MSEIFLITDYSGRFGTRYTAQPYRSGMDKKLLTDYFRTRGVDTIFVSASEAIRVIDNPEGKVILYTSSEDRGGYYKSFIEDVVLSLEERGAITIPRYIFLRAHNNKDFVEMLRPQWGKISHDALKSECFGSLEEFDKAADGIRLPAVIKRPEGFKSRGVYLSSTVSGLRSRAASLSLTLNIKDFVKDRLRLFIHKGFRPESSHRKKFLVQEFLPNLTGDWKVLIYGEKYYVLRRETRKDDFRASGSGLFTFPDQLPEGLLDFASQFPVIFNVPQLSLDIASTGNGFSVLEMQFLYFGTYTIEKAAFFYLLQGDKWNRIEGKSCLEEEYVNSIMLYIQLNGIRV